MSICTYKNCEEPGINQPDVDAFLCNSHMQEWIKNIDGIKKDKNKDRAIKAALGTFARATHKNRERQFLNFPQQKDLDNG